MGRFEAKSGRPTPDFDREFSQFKKEVGTYATERDEAFARDGIEHNPEAMSKIVNEMYDHVHRLNDMMREHFGEQDPETWKEGIGDPTLMEAVNLRLDLLNAATTLDELVAINMDERKAEAEGKDLGYKIPERLQYDYAPQFQNDFKRLLQTLHIGGDLQAELEEPEDEFSWWG